MGRAPCCDKGSVKKGPWSPEEDRKLKDYIHKFGTGGNWIALPAKAGLKRCGKSCRLRWLNYLRPNIKHGGFSDEEDRVICSLYASIGSRWSVIAAQLPGRTDNDIKNYWNTKLKKKLLLNVMSHSHSQIRSSKEPPPPAAAANVGIGGADDHPPLALFSQLLLDQQHYHSSSSLMFGIGGDHHHYQQQQQMAPSSSVFLNDFDLMISSGSGSDGLEQSSIFAGLQLQQQEELPAADGLMPQLDHHHHHHHHRLYAYGSSYVEDQHEMKPLVIAPSTGSFLYAAATATPGTRYQY
ncbi:transcription factor RAX2 [Brachypodium distachyon]|uniref:Uncharacterized protein n=1 Tax=Brachypodium distachyon TaxID=15368 RepID=I1IT69_BRADI|nr:transcription factor RAX2 [Brachypodium distachyon]KQJ91657.1 hypothetical protein BRADI_4g38965v3 [Brachypodium distachyon]|eukprot:XP_010239462.1 transcription factor RAX2 [Brachypodium distachyon]